MKQKCWFVIPVMWTFSLAAYGDDALVDGYHLRPATAVVKVGGTVKLKLVFCRVTSDNLGEKPKAKSSGKPGKKYIEDDLAPLVLVPEDGNSKKSDQGPKRKPVEDELAPLVPIDPDSKPKRKSVQDDLAPLPVLKLVCEGEDGYGEALAPLVFPADVKWQVVDGQGRVGGDRKGVTYHAPASRPKPNTATVSATFTYNVGKEKTILLSRITILDEVKTYTGTFSVHDVTVNSEYTRDLAGKIKWDFEEYYDIGGWREYTGTGTAALSIKRIWCGGASFSDVPVEGRLKVHDNKTYEFQINLVGDNELTRTCRRDDFTWKEQYSPSGDGMASGDPCGRSELYEHYTDITDLTFSRNASCDTNLNRIQEAWSFKATE